MTEKIFLVGLPGAGKTTLGRQLAQELAWEFLDLDHFVEATTNKTVPEIFQQGERVFRDIERSALTQIIGMEKKLVLSTGGGTPCFFTSMEDMKAAGTVIFIDTPLDVIIDRVSKQHHRPLLRDHAVKEKISQLNNDRRDHYLKAHHRIQSWSDLQGLTARFKR